jgi:hypothetical protein
MIHDRPEHQRLRLDFPALFRSDCPQSFQGSKAPLRRPDPRPQVQALVRIDGQAAGEEPFDGYAERISDPLQDGLIGLTGFCHDNPNNCRSRKSFPKF